MPNGRVDQVQVVGGPLSGPAQACVKATYASMEIPSFAGESVSIARSLRLTPKP